MIAADRPPPYAGVAFDCDSTLSAIEGIEELGRVAGRGGAELAELTRRAMDGQVPLEDVYGRRLEIVHPTAGELEEVGRRYVATAVPGARALVRALRALEKRVWIVSGGLLPAVRALALHLGVPPDDVHAVDVAFDSDGRYAGFDRTAPLARSGGKPVVLAELAAAAGGPIALVGDGATDLEAAPVLARFVAYGGVVRRAAVFECSAVGSTASDMRALAPLLLAPEELEHALHLLDPVNTPDD